MIPFMLKLRRSFSMRSTLARIRVGLVCLAGFGWLATPLSAALPHVELVGPGVFAAGFADRYGSANCGWVALSDQTMLIDLPHGVGIPEFLAEVEKTTGKPVRSLIRTHIDESDQESVDALVKRGVRLLGSLSERTSIPDAGWSIDILPYGKVTGGAAAAVLIPKARVLFAGPAAVNGPRAKLPGSDITGWIAALTALQKHSIDRVVPGFGSWGKPSILERQRLLFAELRRQVAHNVAMGIPLGKFEKAILIPAQFFDWMPYDTPTVEDIRWVHRELTVPQAPYYGQPPSKSDSQPHALVLISDGPHEPEHIELGLRPVFEATGVIPHFLFDFRGLTAENLKHVSLLVVQRDGYIFPEGKGVGWMTDEQQRAVVQFVEGGGAFLNLHNAMGLYPDDGAYLRLVGGRYIGHGPLERFRTEVVDPQHPVTRGVTDFFCADEQHTPPFETNKVHLLLRNRSDDGKVVAAAGWAYEPGRGRLCHLANGHTRDALNHPMFQRLMRNAVLWCLRKD